MSKSPGSGTDVQLHRGNFGLEHHDAAGGLHHHAQDELSRATAVLRHAQLGHLARLLRELGLKRAALERYAALATARAAARRERELAAMEAYVPRALPLAPVHAAPTSKVRGTEVMAKGLEAAGLGVVLGVLPHDHYVFAPSWDWHAAVVVRLLEGRRPGALVRVDDVARFVEENWAGDKRYRRAVEDLLWQLERMGLVRLRGAHVEVLVPLAPTAPSAKAR